MKLAENEFTTYEFTDQELVQATSLAPVQRSFIQHQIGLLNAEKVNMKLDVEKVIDFAQNEAYIAGQIAAFQFLLTADNRSAEVIKELQMKQVEDAKERIIPGQFQSAPQPFDLNKL